MRRPMRPTKKKPSSIPLVDDKYNLDPKEIAIEEDVPKSFQRLMNWKKIQEECLTKKQKQIKTTKQDTSGPNTMEKNNVNDVKIKKRVSDKKREKMKRNLERLKSKKKKNNEDKEDAVIIENKVKFGDVVQQPPKLDNFPKLAQRKLTKSLKQQETLEKERMDAIKAYRLLKQKQIMNRNQ